MSNLRADLERAVLDHATRSGSDGFDPTGPANILLGVLQELVLNKKLALHGGKCYPHHLAPPGAVSGPAALKPNG